MLVDSKRLASNGRLVNLQEGVLSNDAAVSGNDGTLNGISTELTITSGCLAYLFKLKNVTRHDLRGVNLDELTVAEDDSFQGQSLL